MDKFIKHSVITIILFFSLLVFVRIGIFEIQPGEEGLNAIGARMIKDYPVSYYDKFVSIVPAELSNPPLVKWMASVSMRFFGEGEFALRLFPALCSLLSILMLYLVSSRLLNYELSIIAVILLASSLSWNYFSRMGISVIPGAAFALTDFWLILNINESENIKRKMIYMAGLGISTALLFLSNILAAFLPVVFIAGSMILKRSFTKNILPLTGYLAGMIIASLHYISEAAAFGPDLIVAMTGNSIGHVNAVQAIPENFFESLNALSIGNPFTFFAVFYIFMYYYNYKKNDSGTHGKYITNILIWWFVLLLVFYSVFGFNNTLIPLMLPPALILSIRLYADLDKLIKSNRMKLLLYLLFIILFIWSLSLNLRDDFGHMAEYGPTKNIYVFFGGIIILLIFILLAEDDHIEKVKNFVFGKVMFVFVIVLLTRVIIYNSVSLQGDSFGAVDASMVIKEFDGEFVYLYHDKGSESDFNSQLAWYTGCMMCGRDSTRKFIPIGMKSNKFDLGALRKIDKYPDDIVIYYITEEEDLTMEIIKDILHSRVFIDLFGNYAIFSKKRYERRNGLIL